MTEKRFIYKIKNGAMVIIDKKDNVLIRDKYRACDYLNQLNNENEQLKQQLNEQDKIIQELKSYLLHMGYKTIQHDDGHISLEQIEIKKMEIRNGLLDGWIE